MELITFKSMIFPQVKDFVYWINVLVIFFLLLKYGDF